MLHIHTATIFISHGQDKKK